MVEARTARLSLKDLLIKVPSEQVAADQLSSLVGPLVLDSRLIQSGDTFVAIEGYQTDGRNYISSALDKGAGLVIAEANQNQSFLASHKNDRRVVWISDLNQWLSQLAANYYEDPSHALKAIGITGTNGKTSCSFLIAKTLQKMHFECYLLGTLGVGQSSRLQTSENTTADAITMQKILAEAVAVGAQFAAMEISSHGIAQFRANAVKLTTSVFTNLTHDHLDYHGSMENYGSAKRKLFLADTLKNAVINMDDRFGRKLANDDAIHAKKWLVTTKLPTPGSDLDHWIWAEDVVFSMQGIRAKIYSPWGTGSLDSPLIGQFNLSNLLLVIAAVGSILRDLEPILLALKSVHSAPGRMQKIGNENTPLAIIDYAHTPDALEQTLLAIREHCVGLIWCVFGCGGDRDISKRALMARIAEKLANRVIVTTDNPRTESADKIREDIFAGLKRPEKVEYIEDRKAAIEAAIALANPGDAILVAGKGHEDYQIIGTEKKHLSDIEIATDAIARWQHE